MLLESSVIRFILPNAPYNQSSGCLMIAIQALFLNIDYIVVSVILKVQKSNSDTKFETNRLLKYNLGRIPEVAKG